MKNLSSFDQFLTLQEGINLDSSGLNINILKNSDSLDDDFIVNRNRDYFKKLFKKIPVYFGFQPNPSKGFSESGISEIYNKIKIKDSSEMRAEYAEELRKLIILTSPNSLFFDKIIIPESSSILNFFMAKTLAKKYGNLPESNIYVVPKIEYLPDDMINREKYDRSDPVTQKMADTFVRSVKRKFGSDRPVVIKKSGEDGEGGIQSGGRVLLNPVFSIPKIFSKKDKILIVDDFIITGSSIAEISRNLIEDGVSSSNIFSYVLGVKKFSKDVDKEISKSVG